MSKDNTFDLTNSQVRTFMLIEVLKCSHFRKATIIKGNASQMCYLVVLTTMVRSTQTDGIGHQLLVKVRYAHSVCTLVFMLMWGHFDDCLLQKAQRYRTSEAENCTANY